MSGLKKMIEALSKVVKFSEKMKTTIPEPSKVRTYESIKGKVNFESQFDQSLSPVSQLEEIDPNEKLMLLDDIEKESILCLMEYYEYLDTFTGEFVDNQEFIQKCNDLFIRLSEDRPVKKEILLELCPEFYNYEIMSRDSPIPLEELYKNLGLKPQDKAKVLELEQKQERALMISEKLEGRAYKLTPPKNLVPDDYRFRIGKFSVWDPQDTKVQEIFRNEHYSPFEINRRIVYIWEQVQRTFLKSVDTIDELIEKLGSAGAMFTYLQMKGDKCTPEEKEIIEGTEYVNRLMKEQLEFVQSFYDFHMNHVVLPFPMPDWLRTQFLDSMRTMIEKDFIDDFSKAIGIPDNSEKMIKEIKIREQKARDALIVDEKDRKKAVNLLIEKGDEILIRRDLSAKDDNLIRKMNLLSDSFEVIKPDEPIPDFSKVFNPAEQRFKQTQENLILMNKEELHIENLIKILYLNNSNPEEYNFEFWAKTLNISIKKLKNIFYNLSYFVITKGMVVGKLSFIEVEKKKEIFDAFQESLKREFVKPEK